MPASARSEPASDLAQAAEPRVITIDGVRVGFVATDSIGETPAAGRSSPGTNRINAPPRTGPLDTKALDRVADSVRDLEADVVIALPHWGTQYTNKPERSQRRIARALADAGVDVVVGRPPALGAGLGEHRGRHRRALAGQLRLRHGLHAGDERRDLRRDREPRWTTSSRSSPCRTSSMPGSRRGRPAISGPTTSSTRIRRDQRAAVRRSASVSQPRALQPGGHDRADPFELTLVDDPREVAGPSGTRHTGCCRPAPTAGRPARTTSGRWRGCCRRDWSGRRRRERAPKPAADPRRCRVPPVHSGTALPRDADAIE